MTAALHALSTLSTDSLGDDHPARAIAGAVAGAGGRGLIVGGWVRDRLLGRTARDIDLEVYGLTPAQLVALLDGFGGALSVGRSFPVYRVRGLDLEVSLPRADSRRGVRAEVDPWLEFADASRRRDCSVNAIGWDPLTGELLDPLGGREDLAAGRLRACDPERFADDPLRLLRVARLRAVLGLEPVPALSALCGGLDLSSVAVERVFRELSRILLESDRPSRALEWLHAVDGLTSLRELASLRGVPQDSGWHPEGDVWVHTLLVIDAAAGLRLGVHDDDLALLWAALCHDLGKPACTHSAEGRVRALGHERVGAELTAALLERLRAPLALARVVVALVRHHLAPAALVREGARARAYRRLARRLAEAGTNCELLERVARADQLGRTTQDALSGHFPSGDVFTERVRELAVARGIPPDVVRGRDLLARGLAAGPEIGRLLLRCRAVQDSTGLREIDPIVERVLAQLPGSKTVE